ARDPLDDPVRPLAVVVDSGDDLEVERHCRGDQSDEQCRPEAVHVQVAVRQIVRREQHQGVEDEDEQEAEDERQRQAKRRDDGGQERVQDGDDRRGGDRGRKPVDRRPRQDFRRDEQRERREEPAQQELDRPQPGALGLPVPDVERGGTHASASSPTVSIAFPRLAFISPAFSFASAYESLTSFEPPLQPKTMQINTTAKTTLNAVVISCCPIEYAVAVVELV